MVCISLSNKQIRNFKKPSLDGIAIHPHGDKTKGSDYQKFVIPGHGCTGQCANPSLIDGLVDLFQSLG